MRNMLGSADHRRQMPLAIHNTTFGRCYTRTTGTHVQGEAAPVVVHILDAFADVTSAVPESTLPVPTQHSIQGAVTDSTRARFRASVLDNLCLETCVARNTLAYLNRPLPPTPTSVTSVSELRNGWSIAQMVRTSSTSGRYYDAPSEADILAYANRPLPATPAFVSSVPELKHAAAMTIAIARPNLIYIDKPLPPTPSTGGSSRRLSDDSPSSAEASFDSRSKLYSPPDVPIEVEKETEAKASGAAWLRRVKRRATYLLKRLGCSRGS